MRRGSRGLGERLPFVQLWPRDVARVLRVPVPKIVHLIEFGPLEGGRVNGRLVVEGRALAKFEARQ